MRSWQGLAFCESDHRVQPRMLFVDKCLWRFSRIMVVPHHTKKLPKCSWYWWWHLCSNDNSFVCGYNFVFLLVDLTWYKTGEKIHAIKVWQFISTQAYFLHLSFHSSSIGPLLHHFRRKIVGKDYLKSEDPSFCFEVASGLSDSAKLSSQTFFNVSDFH